MSPEVDTAGMLLLRHDQAPAIVWIVDVYEDPRDVRALKAENITNWSYIVLVPRPLANSIHDWTGFLTNVGERITEGES